MAVYRFRVTFEDYDDISRDIELKALQTFEDFHQAIQSSIGFDASKSASFYMSDDQWKKGKEFTNRELKAVDKGTVEVMKKCTFKDHIIDPHQKIYYVSDFADQWTFHIELIKIFMSEENISLFPRCIKKTGDAPKQYGATTLGAVPEPDEFDEAAALRIEAEEMPEGMGVDADAEPTSVEDPGELETADDEMDEDAEDVEEI